MSDFLTFNDGVADFYKIENISDKGDRPKEKLVFRCALRFGYKTIGIKRNYEAMQANVMLDELICTPMNRNISPQDVAVINNIQYRIEQIQHDNTTLPPSSKISLSRLEEIYEFKKLP